MEVLNMQPKSNFDFMKDTKFSKTVAGEHMYKCALAVENLYKNNKEYCALKARLFLEYFLDYVKNLKKVDFPKKIYTIGSYYSEPNDTVFHSVFRYKESQSIISINRASRPYLHTSIPREDALFNDIVENVYMLLVWLMNELDSTVNIKPKYNKTLLPKIPYLSNEILYESAISIPPEKTIKSLFPNCNTDLLYHVEKKDNTYVLKDFKTGEIVETIERDPEIYNLETDIDIIRQEMEEAKKKYDELSKKLFNSVDKEQYLQDMNEQAHRYSELEDKMTNIVPANNQMADLRRDLERGLKDKNRIIKEQQAQLNDLEGRIDDTKQNLKDQKNQLAGIKNELASTGIHMAESDAMLSHMSQRLMENEEELEAIRTETKNSIREIQQGYEEQGVAFYKKLDSIEKVLTQIALENALLKEKLEAIDSDRTQPVLEYMAVCTGSLNDINESCNIYAQDHNAEEFKNRIAEAYMTYTNRVNNLDREHNKQSSDSEIYNKPDITDVEFTEIPTKNRDDGNNDNKGYKKFIIAAVLMIFLFAVAFLIFRIKDVQDQNDQLIELLTEKLNSASEKTSEYADREKNHAVDNEPVKLVNTVDGEEKDVETTKEPENTRTPTEETKPTEEVTVTPEPTQVATVTPEPTKEPTSTPTLEPTKAPTSTPTPKPTKAPTSTPTPKPTKAPTSTPTPKPTKAPTSTPTPKPTKAPTSTPTPKPTKAPTSTPVPTEAPNNLIPAVDDLYNNIDTPVKAPESLKKIKGINSNLLADLNTSDRNYFNGQLDDVPNYSPNSSTRKTYIERHEDIFEYIGELKSPQFFLGSYYGVECRIATNNDLIRYKPAKVFKFIYCRDGSLDNSPIYVAGILPNELCDSIDGNSKLEDFQKVLGTRYRRTIFYEGVTKTDLSTTDIAMGAVFTCENGEAIVCMFDKNGNLCDYIYLLVIE